MKIDYRKFGLLIRQKRADQSLRDAQQVTGVSFSTLSRVERGDAGDLRISTFLSLCEWAGISLADLALDETISIYQPQEIVFNGVSIRIEVRPVQ